MANANPIISALEQYSKTVCSKLTESLDSDEYKGLYDNLKDKISELEAATGPNGEKPMMSEQGEVQAALSIARGWQVKLLEGVNFIVTARQVMPVIKK